MAEKRYIDADKLTFSRVRIIHSDGTIGGWHAVVMSSVIKDAPAEDVVEVRHGYWIPSPDGINPIRCSECNMPAPFVAGENEFGDFEICRYPSKYCHECGAKMDGERKDKP